MNAAFHGLTAVSIVLDFTIFNICPLAPEIPVLFDSDNL